MRSPLDDEPDLCHHGDPPDRCETCDATTRLTAVFGQFWDTGIGHNFNYQPPIDLGRPQ